MFTPILMLVTLTLPYAVSRFLTIWRGDRGCERTAAAIGAGLLFLLTASGHFTQVDAMMQMLPAWVPARQALVLATGVLEIVIALGFFSRRWRPYAAWAAIAVLVGFFPVNIYAAFVHAPMGGHAWGPVYLLVRAPLQAVIVAWIWYFLVRGQPRPWRA